MGLLVVLWRPPPLQAAYASQAAQIWQGDSIKGQLFSMCRASTSHARLHTQLKTSCPLPQQAGWGFCGIHSIDVNPARTLVVTGGKNPTDAVVLRLPDYKPLRTLTVGWSQRGRCSQLRGSCTGDGGGAAVQGSLPADSSGTCAVQLLDASAWWCTKFLSCPACLPARRAMWTGCLRRGG